MLMAIYLNIIVYTVIFVLDPVCQFHIQIMWYTFVIQLIYSVHLNLFTNIRHQTYSLQTYFNPLDNWMACITQLNDY